MGKNDFMSPKAIANRIKSKGLQKLRWYCQMCQKQCRDENGFKCHLTSEGHKRQMIVFGQAPTRVVHNFTEQFQEDFLQLLKQAHGQTRVAAKVVYNEYINDRHHIHMNSTNFLTLTDFVKHLGKEGICRVDETPKGWFVSLIMKDPMEHLSDERRIKRAKHEKADEDRLAAELSAQMERARAQAENGEAPAEEPAAPAELIRQQDDAPLSLSLGGRHRLATSSKPAAAPPEANGTFAAVDEGGAHTKAPARPKSKLEQLMERDLAAKQRVPNGSAPQPAAPAAAPPRADAPWVAPGIIVKVMSKQLPDYYKKKGAVCALPSAYVAEIEMADSGDVLRVDQAQLETVLPAPPGKVVVLAGKHKGQHATLVGVNADKYQAEVQLQDGAQLSLEYEQICKLA